MSDLLIDIEAYFVQQGVVETMFRDTMLDTPDDASAVYEYAGQSGIAQADVHVRSVQIVSRSKSASSAKVKARQLHSAILTEDGIINMPNGRWCVVHIMQPPFKIKVDNANRVYYGFNVQLTTYND